MIGFTLKGQDFAMRDLRVADAGKYTELFNGLSEESICCRFGNQLAKLSTKDAEQRILKVHNERAIAVFDASHSKIVAVARCCLVPATDESEEAIVVAEPNRRSGLARFLLEQLIAEARKFRCKSVSAYIATRNAPVIKLLISAGFHIVPHPDNDDLKLTLQLNTDH